LPVQADQEWDTARAVGAFIMFNYYGATGRNLTFEQFKALVKQVRAIWATDPVYRGKTNREKQESYEFLVIMGSYISIGRTGAEQKREKEVLKLIEKMAKRNLQTLFGAPSSQLRFSNTGYEIVS
jgi:hypothetical protein